MSRLFSMALGGLCLMLTACFVSDGQLIGEGVVLPGGAVRFCTGSGEPCHDALRSADGYLVLPPEDAGEEDGPVLARFRVLTEVGDDMVWLAEVQLDSQHPDRIYMVTRQAGPAPDGAILYDLVLPDCAEAAPDERSRLRIAAMETGGLCRVTDVDALAAYLIDHHGADFAEPDWWGSGS